MSKKEEKSLFDEIWETVKLEKAIEQQEEAPQAPAAPIEEPVIEEPMIEEPVVEEAIVEEPAAEEPIIEEPAKEPEAKAAEHTEKKKSVQFLIIYTTVFLLVVGGLIGGSYMITSRIHKEMAEKGELISDKSSTLKNVKDKLSQTQKEKEEVQQANDDLTANLEDADALIGGAGDMVEHNEYLSAAMASYIDGERDLARSIFRTIDREKLSPTNQDYYDILKKKLG